MNPLRLNLGCGDKLIDDPEWLNIDCRKIIPESAIFLRHDLRTLRGNVVQDGAVLEIMANDVLEHFWLGDAKQLLADWYAMLRDGGKLTIKTPVIEKLVVWARTHDAKTTAFRWYGGNTNPHNVHKFCWPERMLLDELKALGFELVDKRYEEDTNIVVEVEK